MGWAVPRVAPPIPVCQQRHRASIRHPVRSPGLLPRTSIHRHHSPRQDNAKGASATPANAPSLRDQTLAPQYDARCIGMMTWVLSFVPAGRTTPALAEFCISSATCGVRSAPSTSLR